MLLRIQTAEQGTKRIDISEKESTAMLYEKSIQAFQLQTPKSYQLYRKRDMTQSIRPSASTTVRAEGLSHGDMLFLFTNAKSSADAGDLRCYSKAGPVNGGLVPDEARPPPPEPPAVSKPSVVEDEVDRLLSEQDGSIQRPRNEQFCRHNKFHKCVHCIPLDPWDETYLKERDPPVKFLSFHSYTRKLKSGVDKGKFVFLEDINCKITPGCTDHPPWPNGICTKCQPNAVTLSRQTYRHVDYVAFQNPSIVQTFLDFWRKTGFQRVAYMYGRYEPHLDVPLGIKAVVYSLYEPPQSCSANSIELLEDPREDIVQQLASSLGLSRVGWIFSDLLPEDTTLGTVKHLRGPHSYFLSAEETITAAFLQTKHPNPCKLAKSGNFGSKFVTVCATGDSTNQIHFEAYQISNQGMALVRDDCLVPTHDCSELGYIRESSSDQYVPDVFYKFKDEFGNERTQLGRPLPIEYLLIDLPAGFPLEEVCFFHKHGKQPFPACNREMIGEAQDFPAMCKYFHQFGDDEFYKAICDFQLLIALACLDVYPLLSHMEPLIRGIAAQDKDSVDAWSRGEHWQTVHQLMDAHGSEPMMGAVDGLETGGGGGGGWACNHCTFHNPASNQSCEMCGLPRNG